MGAAGAAELVVATGVASDELCDGTGFCPARRMTGPAATAVINAMILSFDIAWTIGLFTFEAVIIARRSLSPNYR